MSLFYKTESGEFAPASVEQILESAYYAIDSKVRKGDKFTSPSQVKTYLKAKLSHYEHEVFGVLFLNAQNQIIEYKEKSHGSILSCQVHPREIAKEAIKLNAVSVILSHNHPGGEAIASMADINITDKIKDALALIECKVLDHIIIAGNDSLSFSESSMI
jgi:DNA repair protein RadC